VTSIDSDTRKNQYFRRKVWLGQQIMLIYQRPIGNLPVTCRQVKMIYQQVIMIYTGWHKPSICRTLDAKFGDKSNDGNRRL
jgi:hypothetical protein